MLGNESVPFRTICSMTGLHSIFEIQPKISKNYIYHPNQFPHMMGNTVHGITILSGLRKHQLFFGCPCVQQYHGFRSPRLGRPMPLT